MQPTTTWDARAISAEETIAALPVSGLRANIAVYDAAADYLAALLANRHGKEESR